MKILLDTNVLIRIVKKRHPEYSITMKAIAKLLSQGEELFYSPEGLVEMCVVLRRAFGQKRSGTLKAIRLIESVFYLIDNSDYLTAWIKLYRKCSLGVNLLYDLKFVAIAVENGMDAILTFDTKHYQRFKEINILNPRSI